VKGLCHCGDAPILEPQRSLQALFAIGGTGRLKRIGCYAVINGGEARYGGSRKTGRPLQIAFSNEFALRMHGQPIFSETEKLLDFLVADPIVLVAVEHGHQDVEVVEQLLQGGCG
jgi:hypothetical protein